MMSRTGIAAKRAFMPPDRKIRCARCHELPVFRGRGSPKLHRCDRYGLICGPCWRDVHGKTGECREVKVPS